MIRKNSRNVWEARLTELPLKATFSNENPLSVLISNVQSVSLAFYYNLQITGTYSANRHKPNYFELKKVKCKLLWFNAHCLQWYIDENKEESLKNSELVNRKVFMSVELYLPEGSEGNKGLYGLYGLYRGSSKSERKQQRSLKTMAIKLPLFSVTD